MWGASICRRHFWVVIRNGPTVLTTFSLCGTALDISPGWMEQTCLISSLRSCFGSRLNTSSVKDGEGGR
ncbi:putative transmembrane protein [Mycobacterium kansasii]|uniref:Putative transmembrane protein n=1 Tax=Mycobacterium kansasii TaxID=1768 RepID=A0A1V3W9H5_MYCKA|nr:putative transmembrane protein [Mycobacterium kansasii]